MVPYSEQRANPRYRCRCYASLEASNESWPAHLVNISRSGCLVAVLTEPPFEQDQRLALTIEFENNDKIELSGEIVHVKAHYVGLKYDTLTELEADRLTSKLETLRDHALT